MSFTPNHIVAGYKTKEEAIVGILDGFVNTPNAADAEGNIIFLLGKNVVKIKPNKKKKYEENAG